MSAKVLFVDDEPNILEAYRRQLRRHFDLATAEGPDKGLEAISENGSFAVVVSDLRMPGMTGIEFLAKVSETSPDTVRMMLTGQADLESAIASVNEGHIFRFLTKPCPTENLVKFVESALEQHRLIVAERELLEGTLSGAVQVLTEILGVVNPTAFSRASRIQGYAETMARELGLDDRWQLRLAAMLSQIGCISLPAETLAKHDAGQRLTKEERDLVRSHPEVAGKLLSRIPRMDTVAKMVAGQMNSDDTSRFPDKPEQWDLEIAGAQILRASVEFDRMVTRGMTRDEAVQELKEYGKLSPSILAGLDAIQVAKRQQVSRAIMAADLMASMVLDEDVKTKTGLVLAPRGQTVTEAMLARLQSFARGVGINEPFRVRVAE